MRVLAIVAVLAVGLIAQASANCASSPSFCKNNGTCVDYPDTVFNCTCPSYFSGANCQWSEYGYFIVADQTFTPVTLNNEVWYPNLVDGTDSAATVQLWFNFTFRGQTYEAVQITSAGTLLFNQVPAPFTAGSGAVKPVDGPTTLVPTMDNSTIWTQTTGNAGSQVFTAGWNLLTDDSDPTSFFTFSVSLYEADGSIVVRYNWARIIQSSQYHVLAVVDNQDDFEARWPGNFNDYYNQDYTFENVAVKLTPRLPPTSYVQSTTWPFWEIPYPAGFSTGGYSGYTNIASDLGDEGSVSTPLPFTISLWGASIDTIEIDADGNVFFTLPNDAPYSYAPRLYGVGDRDLNPGRADTWGQVFTVDESATANRFIVVFHNVPYYSSSYYYSLVSYAFVIYRNATVDILYESADLYYGTPSYLQDGLGNTDAQWLIIPDTGLGSNTEYPVVKRAFRFVAGSLDSSSTGAAAESSSTATEVSSTAAEASSTAAQASSTAAQASSTAAESSTSSNNAVSSSSTGSNNAVSSSSTGSNNAVSSSSTAANGGSSGNNGGSTGNSGASGSSSGDEVGAASTASVSIVVMALVAIVAMAL